eukprot:TRINITY_DN1867_c0_g1_i1.p1 TRINITY_DN1867_c0_g1~~TRINITY_DN1867_c0_g1_i1.p1  ORF type:complete len:689 (+),score=143.27 TRINITY_DN1867_c0_g1_i1:209-2068(+)
MELLSILVPRLLKGMYTDAEVTWSLDSDEVLGLQRVEAEKVSEREACAPPLPVLLKQELLGELRKELSARQPPPPVVDPLASLAQVAGAFSSSLTEKRGSEMLLGEPKQKRQRLDLESPENPHMAIVAPGNDYRIQALEEEQEELKAEINQLKRLVERLQDFDGDLEGGESWLGDDVDSPSVDARRTTKAPLRRSVTDLDEPTTRKAPKKRTTMRRKTLEDDEFSDEPGYWDEVDQEWGSEGSKGGRSSLRSSQTKTKPQAKRATNPAKAKASGPPTPRTRTRSGTISRQASEVRTDDEDLSAMGRGTRTRKPSAKKKSDDYEEETPRRGVRRQTSKLVQEMVVEDQGGENNEQTLLHAQLLESLRESPLTFEHQVQPPLLLGTHNNSQNQNQDQNQDQNQNQNLNLSQSQNLNQSLNQNKNQIQQLPNLQGLSQTIPQTTQLQNMQQQTQQLQLQQQTQQLQQQAQQVQQTQQQLPSVHAEKVQQLKADLLSQIDLFPSIGILPQQQNLSQLGLMSGVTPQTQAQQQALRQQVTAQALQAQAHAKAMQAQAQAQVLQAQAHVQALQLAQTQVNSAPNMISGQSIFMPPVSVPALSQLYSHPPPPPQQPPATLNGATSQ